MNLVQEYRLLTEAIGGIDEVVAVGKSGGERLPERGEGDIDIFVFCDSTPDIGRREAAIKNSGAAVTSMNFGKTKGRFWGICDFVFLDDAEICFMYFEISEMDAEIESVLNGSRLKREDEYFYPTGRCASFLTMHVVSEKNGYISAMKERLAVYPPVLAGKLIKYHLGKINNREDFERAVSRGDTLFFHAALEGALDHFLQALFALNKCYFPSRKRTLQYIESFRERPRDCGGRILSVIESGSRPETLSESYAKWRALCEDLAGLTSPSK